MKDSFTLDEVVDLLRVHTQGRKAAEFAREAGISTGYVYDVLKRRYPPGPKMLAALGVQKVVLYVPDGETCVIVDGEIITAINPTIDGDFGCA